ncbi:hypothetical protein HanRHA438_Chr15g0701541 [Helianthus annuus]|nr:hypothetical protein HanRHA438_Chr15g0701541 [Helianthus annuus]
MIIIFCFVSLILSCHSATTDNVSMNNCPESFGCPALPPFKYPFYNVMDTRCGLIKVNCTSKGGEIQLGGGWYEIVNKDEGHNTVIISNKTFEDLVKKNSCEALMNNFTSPSPSLFCIPFQYFLSSLSSNAQKISLLLNKEIFILSNIITEATTDAKITNSTITT